MVSKREREWEEGLTDAQALCRDTSIHHAWTPGTVERTKGGFVRYLSCARCGAGRKQKLDSRGYILPGGSAPRYPAGYLRPKGSGYASKEDNARIRLRNLKTGSRRGLRAVGEDG